MATQLTTQQLATLKAAILAETDPAFVTARPTANERALRLLKDAIKVLAEDAAKSKQQEQRVAELEAWRARVESVWPQITGAQQ
jgi:predicted GTPase